MKKIFVMAAAAIFAASAVTFVSCGKGDDDFNTGLSTITISGTLDEIPAEQIREVKVISGSVYLEKATVSNGQFSMQLSTPPDSYLEILTLRDGLISDNANVIKYFYFEKLLADNGRYIGKFQQDNLYREAYYYVSDDVKITGSFVNTNGRTFKYNLNLKKGWNVVFLVDTGSNTTECKTDAKGNNMLWKYM